MFDYYKRTPQVEIEIRRPDYLSSNPSYSDSQIVVFGSSNQNNISTDCLGYNFSESVDSIDTDFSFSTTLAKDGNNLTWYDKIHVRDLVFIKENGITKFCGVVTNRRYGSRMADKGPQRQISISGKSIGSLLSTFVLLLDQHILSSGAVADAERQKFMADLSANIEKGQTLSGVVQSIINSFFSLMDKVGNTQNKGIRKVINQFFDFTSGMASNVTAQYPIVISLYQMGENNLWSILQQLLTVPFQELYGQWIGKKFVIKFRKTPFDPSDWIALPIKRVPEDILPVFIQDYDLGDSDNDVKTFYVCSLPGSAISREKALTIDNYGRAFPIDSSKWAYYGYRPMLVECRFFNRDPSVQFSGAEDLMHKLSETLFRWYKNNTEYLSGTITLHNVINKMPNIGERMKLLGGEFYVQSAQHSWSYGGALTLSVSITRGYRRKTNGEDDQPIGNIGPRIGLIESAGVRG